jgi:hypothetical protein
MNVRGISIAIAAVGTWLLLGTVAWAQRSTAVQLPTWSQFSTSTTVSVPDRGATYLGGVKRARSGSNQFGAPLVPFGNRATGGTRSASGMSVHVTVHDFEAMDAYLLGEAGMAGTQGVAARKPVKPDPWAARLRRSQLDRPMEPASGVAAAAAKRATQEENRQAEAVEFFQQGRRLEEEGKPNVARIYYQMAGRRASGQLRRAVAARLEALEPVRVAQRDGR